MVWTAFLPKGLAEWGRLAAIAFACFFLGQCRGEGIGERKMELALEKANADALREKGRADNLASEQRLADTVAINTQEKELLDAIASTPDSAPDAARIALGCERLRRSNPSGASLPASCRSSR